MTGYEKGTTPPGEMAHLREAFASCAAAIQACPDAAEAWAYMKDLSALIQELSQEGADYRAWLAASLLDTHRATVNDLAAFMDITPTRVRQIIARAREKGNPVTDPLTLPEQPHVALAIITSDQGVLVARRQDKIPPWTFPGGEIEPGEPAADAIRRRVLAETGLTVTEVRFFGRRLHDVTSRVMVYALVSVEPGEPVLGDPADLVDVRWATIDETRTLMPTMYGPVRQYLDELQREPAES